MPEQNQSPDTESFFASPAEGRFVAEFDDVAAGEPGVGDATDATGSVRDGVLAADSRTPETAPRGLWGEAWLDLRRRPLFYVAAAIIALVVLVSLFPGLFTSIDPTQADLAKSLAGPEPGHPFGFTQQGYDVYARTVYGARASVITGIGVTAIVTVFGVLVGAVAGYYGGWADVLLSRFTDVFFAIPLILAGIVLMQMFTHRTILTVVLVLAAFGWPQMARIARGAVIAAKQNDYVQASRALGLSRWAILMRHVLPNSLAPIIVMVTTSLGIFIVAEATLSYLGIGLPTSTVSWGNDISAAQVTLRRGSTVLFYPATALAITVLGFIMMGDALRDALDPKARKR